MDPMANNKVALEKKEKQQAVQMVSEWALRTAVGFAFCFAFTLAMACYAPQFLLRDFELTGAAAAEERAIIHAVPWSTAAQAAAAALALLLPADRFHRSRLALACVALAAAAATHLMVARVTTLFVVADPAGILWWAAAGLSFVVAVGDINCAQALIDRKRSVSKRACWFLTTFTNSAS